MDTKQTPYHVVVGYDFSPESRAALEQAWNVAKHQAPVFVHVLYVLSTDGPPSLHRPTFEDAEKCHERILEDITRHQVAPSSDIKVFAHARIGPRADSILALANEVGASLIAVGTHGRSGLARWALGSVAEAIVRDAQCPVFVARRGAYKTTSDASWSPEPPCPRCVSEREQSSGGTLWCSEHRRVYSPPLVHAPTNASIRQLRPVEWTLW